MRQGQPGPQPRVDLILIAPVGHAFTSAALAVAFLTLTADSILYVVIQLLGVAAKIGRKEVLCWGILVGLAAGFITDMVVTAGGV